MRKIFLFMNVSLDGCFEGPGHDLSWTKNDFEPFAQGESGEVDTVLFGRKTYEMMRSFWPTPQAAEMAPDIAKFMNERHKIVASRQDYEPGWQNVEVVHDAVAAVKRLKEQPGGTIAVFGSNNLVVSLMPDGLIDEFQILVNPVALGAGTPLFSGLAEKVPLRFAATHPFASGTVLLTYHPARA